MLDLGFQSQARMRFVLRQGVMLLCLAVGVPIATGSLLDPCPDTNGDGILDNGDISEFVSLFLTNDARADFNGDGFLDNGDIGSFVSLFLAGAPCTPEIVAVDGALVGTRAMDGAAPSFLGEHRLAEPSVVDPVPGPTGNSAVLAAGTDTDGSVLLVLRDILRRELVLERENGVRQTIPLGGDGISTPLDLDSLPTVDTQHLYEPVAARVHDGLLMVVCKAHRFLGTGDPSLSENWNQSDTVALLWRNIDDPDWTVIRDTSNPTVGHFGAVWTMGIPILPADDTLLLGWTNYQWKLPGNGPNSAFLSEFERGPDGRWSHRVSIELLKDGSATADQHFHTAQPYWTGSELRVFIAAGDGVDFNGVYELHRPDLDLDNATLAKPGSQGVMLPGPGWVDAGYVHGGKTQNGYHRSGFQPTYLLPINGRIHCGGDESIPAVASFDPNRPGGTPIDDLVTEYLPHGPDLDSGIGWLSLVGDVNDYANPTAAATMVQPGFSWGGRSEAANRVLYYDGQGWSSVANVDTKMNTGIGIGPANEIYVATLRGALQIHPGTAQGYTPLVSSPGATNAIVDPGWDDLAVGLNRATVTDITDQPALVGANDFVAGTRVLRIEIDTDPAWVAASYTKLMAPVSNRQMLAEGDSFQFRYWVRPLGSLGLNSRTVPIKADTGEYLMRSGSGAPLATTDRFVACNTNDWTEFLNAGEVLEPLGTEPFGFGFLPQTRLFNGSTTEFRYDLAVEGLYINPEDIVSLRPGFGETLPDTNHAVSLVDATLPIEVRGITQPLGASGVQRTLPMSRNLCTLWIDLDNHLSVDADFPADLIRYSGRLQGVPISGDVAEVEWTRGTPVSIHFDESGADLLIRVSTYGGPWSEPAVIPGLASLPWQEFRLFGLTTQSHLGMGSFRATPR